MSYQLNDKFFTGVPDMEASRQGFGRGLKKAGELDERVVAMSADLTESTQAHLFARNFLAVLSKSALPNKIWLRWLLAWRARAKFRLLPALRRLAPGATGSKSKPRRV